MEKKLQKIYLYLLLTFMTSSLPNLVNSLSEETYRIKCKFGHDEKICETY